MKVLLEDLTTMFVFVFLANFFYMIYYHLKPSRSYAFSWISAWFSFLQKNFIPRCFSFFWIWPDKTLKDRKLTLSYYTRRYSWTQNVQTPWSFCKPQACDNAIKKYWFLQSFVSSDPPRLSAVVLEALLESARSEFRVESILSHTLYIRTAVGTV